MTWDRLREAVYLTGRTSAMVCFLFVGSGCFAAIFAYLNGQQLVQEIVRALNLNPVMFLILAQFIIFLLGWPLEWTEIIVIFVPIFLPLLDHFGIDPILFGMLIALNLQTVVPHPAGGDVRDLPQGRGAAARHAHRDFRGRFAVPLDRPALHGRDLRVPGGRAMAAVGALQLRAPPRWRWMSSPHWPASRRNAC